MNMKKVIAGIVACCIVGGTVPCGYFNYPNNADVAFAENVEHGTYESLQYSKYSDHIEIFGCDHSSTEINIPDEIDGLPVTVIKGRAFFCFSSLKSITIPESVTSIEGQAFLECSGLKSINIPENVTSISDGLFSGCSSLKSITLPESITSIGNSAFNRCNIKSLTLPENVTIIGERAFYECYELESITIPDSVTSIGYLAFADCRALSSIKIPDSVTSIGGNVFSGCTSLKSATLSKNITSIEESMFLHCSALESIIIPENVTSIGSHAFDGCSFELITIPKSVTSIDDFALNCTFTSLVIENPECEIYDYSQTISSYSYKGIIYGHEGSTAQAYAKKYGRIFELIENAPTTASPAESPLIGDANCDGEVNIADATAIIQAIGNKDRYALSEQGEKNADCYNVGDGVTGMDAMAIQQLEAGLIKSLPVKK